MAEYIKGKLITGGVRIDKVQMGGRDVCMLLHRELDYAKYNHS
jgi:hypothetical protein